MHKYPFTGSTSDVAQEVNFTCEYIDEQLKAATNEIFAQRKDIQELNEQLREAREEAAGYRLRWQEARKDAAEQSRAASQLADALLRKDEELTEARRLAVSEDDQQAVRMYLWLNHGHQMMYGDDGEMQCVECMPFGLVDYKREPFSKVIKISEEVRMQSNLIKWNEKNIYQGGPDGPMEGM